jgi:glycosyltransferase involved in cell wall biosynthesis
MPAKIVHIDLAQADLSPWRIVPDDGRLFLIVTYGSVPLAARWLTSGSDSDDTVLEIAVREAAWVMWRRHLMESPPVSLPPISVVVCTRDRPQLLSRCLDSLSRIDYPGFEVTVIDNASTDPAVKSVVDRSGFGYVREDRPGLDWARNRGIWESRHSLVSFIDDDAVASPQWLHGVALGFTDPEIAAVTGLILPNELETEAQEMFERYGGMSKGFLPAVFDPRTLTTREMIASHHFGVGANMSFRRDVAIKLGAFDTALDVGTPSGGAGDIDMLHRVVSGGYCIRYEPLALIYHSHRRDSSGLERQIRANGQAYSVYLMKLWRNNSVPRRETLIYSLQWLLGWVFRNVAQGALGRGRFPSKLALEELRGVMNAPWAFRATLAWDREMRAMAFETGATE